MLCLMGFMFVWFPYMLTNLIKSYGIIYLNAEVVDDILLIFPLMNGPTRILTGWLCDIFGFKKVYYSMLFITVNILNFMLNIYIQLSLFAPLQLNSFPTVLYFIQFIISLP